MGGCLQVFVEKVMEKICFELLAAGGVDGLC